MAQWISPLNDPCETIEEACERELCSCFGYCAVDEEEGFDFDPDEDDFDEED